MNKENSKLGRGLSSLLSSKKDNQSESKNFKKINTSSIKANSQQPRKRFGKNEIEDLAASIKSQGILQPIVVRQKAENTFEIIAGERRWRAAQIVGLHEIPAIIKEMNDEEALQAALIENIQRENLNPVEEARAYQLILKDNKINYESLSNLIGKSRSHISNTIRLLELNEIILNYIEEGKISMGHARALIGVPDAVDLAKDIINKKLSVREVEKNTSKYKNKKPKKNLKDPNILNLEQELSEKIGLKTSIYFNDQGSSGSITLYYSDLDQLDDIMKRLKK
ncbi:MAG: putative chromosome-partitioning protein ParB [Alphaproteobacteria bacterium MarineAlpha5_Bin8]|nr:MAG: putative chromosome-partitioning protein ParB [Alphaproteobacteria bacterium MarineAlpha5_Bin7]PPR48366.1 MAG: putative chromosome-partitioning protein ParB [Alphaproteobacteria bacterium MarineAlpha5_Bin8]PPR54758.1 MAG: putative chromosome-partitioning protein ParB [Alphaproteobacteria bacterium MarineAlpha5_Bin6]|tara:strand:+ start:1818 stop:2660 length:843 start_codon:yes stop_codon:yes gene_type:complete